MRDKFQSAMQSMPVVLESRHRLLHLRASLETCIKRNFEGIHDRFLKDPVFRESQLEIDRTEEICIQMDKDAQKDFTYRMTQEEYFRYRKNWWISFKKSGKIGPVRDRSDFSVDLAGHTVATQDRCSGEGSVAAEWSGFWDVRNPVSGIRHPH